jgi:uncharacterized protein (DUF488 family)
MLKVITVGVYGFSEESFFEALQAAGVDTFCDVRQRRGVRGAAYAFANSARLQKRLADLGIRYLHRKDLAPTPAVRRRQQEADQSDKVAKRQRTGLSPAFVEAYRQEILDAFEPQSLLDDLPPGTAVLALFCVEREPTACHRSLLAEKLAEAWQVEVEHIMLE